MTIETLLEIFDDLLNVVIDNGEDDSLNQKCYSIKSYIESPEFADNPNASGDLQKIIQSNLL